LIKQDDVVGKTRLNGTAHFPIEMVEEMKKTRFFLPDEANHDGGCVEKPAAV
jgi:hypothetical protein